jgi:hypothetical protein
MKMREKIPMVKRNLGWLIGSADVTEAEMDTAIDEIRKHIDAGGWRQRNIGQKLRRRRRCRLNRTRS